MKQQHYNFQHHTIHRKTPLKISHMNLYHCQTTVNEFINSHTYPKIIFAYNGSGYISINHQRFPLAENELYLINEGDFLCTIEPNNDHVEFATIGFEDITFTFPDASSNDLFSHISIDHPDCTALLQSILKELLEEEINYQFCCDHYINLLFIYLERHYKISYQFVTKEKLNKDCEFIRNYLDQHFAENITLDILSKESNMNKYYLVHSFTNHYGCSPINYLNEKKIDESKRLLEATNYSIAEIAKLIGFSSQSYFSQSFKKHTYMTPNEYRRSIRHR